LAEKVASRNRSEGGRLEVANINAPGQVVVAGADADIEWVSDRGKDLGVRRVIPLKVAGAFHSRFMAPAADAVGEALTGVSFSDPEFPVWSNTTAQPHQTEELAATLKSQVVSTVRFEESLTNMASAGVDTFVHVGPGDVTAAMARRTIDGATVHVVTEVADIPGVADSLVTVS
jgi:[acyl-carrier-protein] S-malonyltransferase